MKYISREDIEQMYWVECMSARQIAKIVGVTGTTIQNKMRKYGIEARTVSESKSFDMPGLTRDELMQMYWCNGMSMEQIAQESGVSQSCIAKWMKCYGINSKCISDALSGKYTGESNGMWKGGTSFEPYCHKFNDKFKESVRERDDYTCQLCGCMEELNGRKLDVHHIHYDKENCYPDVILLCRSCNGRVNGNMDYWEKYFENLLLERGLLNRSV